MSFSSERVMIILVTATMPIATRVMRYMWYVEERGMTRIKKLLVNGSISHS